jgi:ABC-type sugar transport system ATPase subunit
MSIETRTALRMEHISKTFFGNRVLNDVNFCTIPGEVHVLLGENGAGKSTLMKIAAGVYTKDPGEGKIFFFDKEVELNGIKDAQMYGLAIIHQELNLLPNKTVYQNIFIENEPMKNGLIKTVDTNRMITESERLLQKLGISLEVTQQIKNLSVAQQQMVEVAKALSQNAKILVMDEPTSSLTSNEIKTLFEIIRKLKKSGVSIIYISHRMEEIKEIGDRITILRDGEFIGTEKVSEVTLDQIVTMMVGRKVTNLFHKSVHRPGELALETRGLTGLRFRNCSIKVHVGEVVSLAGLIGAGRTELVKAIFGADPIIGGELFIRGNKVLKPTPRKSIKNGLGLLPEDRKKEGLILQMSVEQNIVSASLNRFFPSRLVNKKKQRTVAQKFADEVDVQPSNVRYYAGRLSGGNQQKVVIAKWLATECDILILDEPTRGIDIGAKAEIYELIDSLANEGKAILIVSSDQMEVAGISDKVYVMRDGEISGELKGNEISPENIISNAV